MVLEEVIEDLPGVFEKLQMVLEEVPEVTGEFKVLEDGPGVLEEVRYLHCRHGYLQFTLKSDLGR